MKREFKTPLWMSEDKFKGWIGRRKVSNFIRDKLLSEALSRAEAVEARVKELEIERKELIKWLRQAYACLRCHGDVNYPHIDQAGNQGLRHVHSALDVLGVDPELEEEDSQ